MEASLCPICPMCSRALKISTIEPHPTRDGVDVVTRRCPIHGDIWRSWSSTKLRRQIRDVATLLLPPRREQARFVWSRQRPGRPSMSQDVAKQRLAFARVVNWV
jgi:hypothetical protein